MAARSLSGPTMTTHVIEQTTTTATLEAPTSWRGTSPLLVLRLRGSQEEMGARHGALLRDLGGWEQTLDFYRRLPERLLFAPGSSRLARALALPGIDVLLRRLERARPPELVARTRAFYAALGLAPADARFMLVMDLFQNLVGLAAKLGLAGFSRAVAESAPPACSSLVAWGRATASGELLHARNFDFPGIGVWDRAPAVVHCAPDRGLRYGFSATRGADVPGVTAWNEAGLVVSTHTRLHRDVRFKAAGVVDLVHEVALRASTLAEAVAITRERRVASTWGLAISSRAEGRALSVEITGRAAEVVEPAAGEQFLAVTNHYRTPALAAREAPPSPGWRVHSGARARRVEGAARRGGLTIDDLERLLGDHRDSDDDLVERAGGSVVSQPATVHSAVVAPARQSTRVSVGHCPTGWGPYVEVPWSWDGPEVELLTAPDGAPAGSHEASRFETGPAGEAYGAFLEGARRYMDGRDARGARAALERAVALDEDEPRYRFFAGVLALIHGEAAPALAHLERGLTTEGAAYRRGNLHLFAARAAALAGDRARAQGHREALFAIDAPSVAPLKRAARDEERRPLGRAALAKVRLNVLLADAR